MKCLNLRFKPEKIIHKNLNDSYLINKNPNWETLLKDPEGTIYRLWRQKGIYGLILKSSISLCGYIGITNDHELYAKNYDLIDLPVHGGLTFSGQGGDGIRPFSEVWWIGWDYAHYGDAMFFEELANTRLHGKKRSLNEVEEDVKVAMNRIRLKKFQVEDR